MDFLSDPMFIGTFALEFGVILGVIFRILLPFVQKKAEDPTAKFDHRYFWSGVLSLFLIQMEIMAFLAQPSNPIYAWAFPLILFFGFQIGLGNTELSARILVGGATAISAYRARTSEEQPDLAKAVADLAAEVEELKKAKQ